MIITTVIGPRDVCYRLSISIRTFSISARTGGRGGSSHFSCIIRSSDAPVRSPGLSYSDHHLLKETSLGRFERPDTILRG